MSDTDILVEILGAPQPCKQLFFVNSVRLFKHVHLMVRLCHYQANGRIKVMIGLGFKLSYGPIPGHASENGLGSRVF